MVVQLRRTDLHPLPAGFTAIPLKIWVSIPLAPSSICWFLAVSFSCISGALRLCSIGDHFGNLILMSRVQLTLQWCNPTWQDVSHHPRLSHLHCAGSVSCLPSIPNLCYRVLLPLQWAVWCWEVIINCPDHYTNARQLHGFKLCSRYNLGNHTLQCSSWFSLSFPATLVIPTLQCAATPLWPCLA